MEQFKGICQALELKTRIDRVTDEFLTASSCSSNEQKYRSFPTSKFHLKKDIVTAETKAFLSRKLQKILNDSPEDFLRQAIEEIKGKNTNP